MSTAFAIACVGCLVLGYALGWRTRDRAITKRADDLEQLRAMWSGHVEAVEYETIARKAGAA